MPAGELPPDFRLKRYAGLEKLQPFRLQGVFPGRAQVAGIAGPIFKVFSRVQD